MADAKPEETFKVIDRRLFGEDGEIRKDVVEQERRDEEAAEKKAASLAQQKAKAAATAGANAAPTVANAPASHSAAIGGPRCGRTRAGGAGCVAGISWEDEAAMLRRAARNIRLRAVFRCWWIF